MSLSAMRFSKLLIAGFLVALFGVGLCFLPIVHELEKTVGLAVLFTLRGSRPAPQEVVVVGVNRDSAERLKVAGLPSRWPRQLHGQLVEQLTRAGARAIVFDLFFIEAAAVSADDEAFAAALGRSRNVVLAAMVRAGDLPSSRSGAAERHRMTRMYLPVDVLRESALAAAPFVLPEFPARINRYWTFQTSLGDVPTFPVVALPFFAPEVYKEFLRLLQEAAPPQAVASFDDVLAAKRLVPHMQELQARFRGDPTLATKLQDAIERRHPDAPERRRRLRALVKLYAGEPERLLNFYGPAATIPTIPFDIALQSSASDKRFAGKVVFVGLSGTEFTDAEDRFDTVFSQKSGPVVSGVEIAATAFANLLHDDPIEPLTSGSYLFLVSAWGALIGMLCFTYGPAKAGLVVGGLSAIYFGCANYLFAHSSLWLPLVVPLVMQAPLGYSGALLRNFLEINGERQRLRKALGFYVPDEVVGQLARNIVDLRRGDQTVEGVCLLTDIAGYTSVSESVSPRELSDLMRRYLEVAIAPIKRHGGVVIDLTGDSILAIWRGAALTEAMRRQACEAAVDLVQAIQRFNASAGATHLPTRIGVHAGPIFLGNIGTGENYRYGARGDTVNTAARLDSLNRQLGTEVLVSGELLAGIEGFLARPAGKFMLKGKNQAVGVFEIFDRLANATAEQRQSCSLFADGLEALGRRSWDEAEQKFSQMVAAPDRRGLPQFYLACCREYRDHPPGESWDGTITLDEK